ncbi:hypothetical protein DRW07_06305 [Alteromonas sediminis]|uniref:Alginate lyase domain-containing protein n=1 Tax=Alteromonas sediminis TaxID=2259342 RepID=A0A3N5Y862_9ALTE|nr:alginate lyase family protein [Alteromonas sediminis]RPJ67149.1 hypothetical protein DRW07_06305 [Alteromonas sediminis]
MFRVILLLCLSFALVSCSRTPVVFPAGFAKQIALKESAAETDCKVPAAYTDSLIFPSKYEGSDGSRDQLNEESEARYRAQTRQINQFSAGIAKLSSRLYRDKGERQDYECVLSRLAEWASQGALLAEANGTGKAIRKWNLALLSSQYLKLHDLHNSLQDEPLQDSRKAIKTWLSKLADKVITDYSDIPRDKINNHQYWAAWAVMVTSAVTQSRTHYNWAKAQFETALAQINSEGFWPNELNRASRAHQYHNFAIAPIITVARFLQVNGDLIQGLDPRLQLLARNVLMGIESQALFFSLTDQQQVDYPITERGRLAWLPVYHMMTDDPLAKLMLEKYQPDGFTRLGGDTSSLFNG